MREERQNKGRVSGAIKTARGNFFVVAVSTPVGVVQVLGLRRRSRRGDRL